jgi:hypothetical protein
VEEKYGLTSGKLQQNFFSHQNVQKNQLNHTKKFPRIPLAQLPEIPLEGGK